MFVVRDNSQLARWRSQKSLMAQPNVTLVLSDTDVAVSAGITNANIPWSSITAASRFQDGFILIQKRLFRWLPDDMLTGSTVAEVGDLLRGKVPTYKVIQA
jgi:hypothetical protein